jgi:F-type H+-transporting ATPase subunit delta
VTGGAAAGRYARALFDVVVKEKADLETVQRDLEGFSALVASHDVLAATFANPAIPASKKKAVVAALLERAGGVTPILSKLILMLAERDRLVLLPDVARLYGERLMDHQKIVRGDVTTAVPLPAGSLRALEQGLDKASGRKVVLESKVDPSIIGGMVTRLGSTVYDGSVTTQLEKMKQALAETAR